MSPFLKSECKLENEAVRPTACVSCGGWEGRLALETKKTPSQEKLEKRGAYPPSAARCVGRLFMVWKTHRIEFLPNLITYQADLL
jgi:hypothetical protein